MSEKVERRWNSTGHHEETPGRLDNVPEFDPRSGDHLWTVSTMYRVDPELFADKQHTPMLDHETLLLVVGPGCFYCEKVYSKLIASRRCGGHG